MTLLRTRPLLVGLAAALLAGCQQDEIRTYQVSKPEMTRLLGAILPHEDSTWFFKLSGPVSKVADHDAEFTAFLEKLRFTKDADKPLAWTLPDGWQLDQNKQPGRHATILVDAKAPPLELAITKLGGQGQAASVLANVNRWRNQLALPAVTEEELGKDTKELKTSAGVVTLVDLTGTGSGKTGAKGPFAGGDRMPPAVVKEQKSDLGYRLPDGWKKAPGDGISVAAFDVRDGDARAKTTVTPLPGPAGGLAQNVNRWRGQVGLQEISDDEVRKLVQDIPVDGQTGKYADLIGTKQRILGVVAAHGGTSWFVKMTGPVDLVGKQKTNFEAFVRSLHFDGGPGGNDG